MTGSLEFPYRLKGKVVFGLIVFLAVSLACLAGLGYFFVAGQLSSGDFMGQRGGKALFAIPFVAACDLLILAYLVRMRGAVVRLTDADLTAGASLRGPNTLPIREIQNIDIRQVDNLRVMYVRAGAGRWAMINESMLPSSQAFDQIQQALLGSRTDWRHTGTTWSARKPCSILLLGGRIEPQP